jgi:CRP-like cAMP-binding protein
MIQVDGLEATTMYSIDSTPSSRGTIREAPKLNKCPEEIYAREHLIRTFRRFAVLPAETETALVSAFKMRTLKTDEHLLKSGVVCSGIAFVSRGIMFSQPVDSDRVVTCDIFSEGEFATNYVSFLTGKPSLVEIVALEDCDFLWLARQTLEELYQQTAGTERLGRLIAEAHFIALVNRTHAVLGQTPAERYQSLLTERPEIIQRVPQYILARWLGVTPESLSRIRRRITSPQRIATGTIARDPSKSIAPDSNDGTPKVPRAPREKP